MSAVVLLKPDCFEEGLVGQAFDWFRTSEIEYARFFQIVNPIFWSRHYKEHVGKPFFPGLVEFMTSGPIFAIIYKGDPADIREEALHFREFYGPRHGPKNLIHASTVEDAVYECDLWGNQC